MSAQVLSAIAPAAPAAPQGTADADASGFKGLLSTVLDAANDADAAPEKAAPVAKAKGDDGKDVAGFLSAPPGLPTPQTVPVLIVANPTPPATGDGAEASSEAAPVQAAPEASLPVGDATAPAPAAVQKGDAAPLTVPTLDAGEIADAKPASKSDQPLIEPALPAPATTKVEPVPAQDAARAAAALEAVAKAASAPAPAPAPVIAPSPAPPAPPLRPLAERTRLSADAPTNAAAGADAAPVVAAASVSPSVSTPVVAASGQPIAHAEAAAAVAREALPADAPADDPASPPPAPVDGGPVAQQARAATHDVALSQVSRASIDATAQIAAQIVRKLEGRSTRFEMALTPDDLGRVDVKLDIDADGRLNARLAFDNPLAATDLKGRADELRRQLQDAGFQLSDSALEFADRDSSSSAFDRGRGEGREGQNRAFAAASRLNAEIDVAQPPRWMALSLSPSGVDLKV